VAYGNSDFVTLARIVRPHGRRGEVAAEIHTDFSERLTKLSVAELWDGKSARRHVAVRSCWLSRSGGGQAIFHFEGVDSITDAEQLVGFEVQLPLGERMVLPPGHYYVTDLIGCEIWEQGAGKLGEVRDVQFTGEEVAGTPILVVNSRLGELLIPLAEEICVVTDVAAKRIEVVLPEGLRELNRE
jgi:16S rRNA processing protein RimM